MRNVTDNFAEDELFVMYRAYINANVTAGKGFCSFEEWKTSCNTRGDIIPGG